MVIGGLQGGQKTELRSVDQLEYCFVREKEIVFAQQKQIVPMSINHFVEMTVFLCLICFSIYNKMQGFLDESGLFIFFFFWGGGGGGGALVQKFKMASKSCGKTIFAKTASTLCRYPADQKFVEIALSPPKVVGK